MGLNLHRIVDFSQVYKEDEDLVGKKAYELGMLWKLNIPLPKGFVITTEFFNKFLHLAEIDKEIKKAQALVHPALSDSIKKIFHPIQEQIMHKHIPQILTSELHKFYRKLSGTFRDRPLNIFSSSSDNKCFIFSNVKGDANLVLKIKKIWSLFPEEPVAIVVQENVKSEMKGKVFTDNPIVDQKLTEKQKNDLLNYCKIIQKHFYFPKEIEYAVRKGKIFVTKINPFTGIVDKSLEIASQKMNKKILAKGIPVNPGIATGPAKIIHNKYGNIKVKKEEVAVISDLDQSSFEKVKNAKAVIIDSILLNSLNKALYRKDFKIPTIEGARNATKLFQNGNVITVNGTNGEIYSGGLLC